jgi:hypothetical protein
MRNLVSTAISVLFVILGASLGSAAENRPSSKRYPPPEVGIGGERFFPNYGDFSTDSIDEPSVSLRVTVPFTPRFAFEAIATVGRRNDEYFQRTEGLYFLQVRQRFRRDPGHRFQPFITYGATGYHAHVKQRDVTIRQPDGSVKTYAGFAYKEFEEPIATAFGAGFQQRLGPYVALRADMQLVTFAWLPLGVRYSTSVSIPLRRYSTN